MATVRELLAEAVSRLAAAGRPNPRLDAELLLASALAVDRTWLLAHATDRVDLQRADSFRRLVNAATTGRPLQYILGHQEFFGREFRVDPSVLIPRPETEFVVELALRLLPRRRVLAADVGTGSGCIGISLACEHSEVRVVGTDISDRALAIARDNARRWKVEGRFFPVNMRTLAGFPRRPCFHLVVSNPPYVAHGDPAVEPAVARFEPAEAVYAGPTGLEVYRELLLQALLRLQPEGYLVLEIGKGQLAALQTLAAALGWQLVECVEDYSHIPRAIALRQVIGRPGGATGSRHGSGA